MLNDAEPLRIQVQTVHAITGAPLADVGVEAVVFEPERSDVVAQALTGANGVAILDLPHDLWRLRLLVRLAGGPGEGVEVSRAELDGEVPAVLEVTPASEVDSDRLALLADQLVATRRVRADDLANDLAAPTADSIVRLLTAGERARLLSDLERALDAAGAADGKADPRLLDPEALRAGDVRIVPIRELPHVDLERKPLFDVDL